MRAFAFGAGFLFAALQFGALAVLEWRLSSGWTTYAGTTAAWLAGSIAGLNLRGGRGAGTALAAGTAAFYALAALAVARPYDLGLLPLHLALVGVSGASSGVFFRRWYADMGSARSLLLHENNGFLAGWVFSFLGFTLYGQPFLLAAPAAAGLALLLLKRFPPS